jgi:GT2 family glycosyltransferase
LARPGRHSIAAIVVAHDGGDGLTGCVASLAAQTGVDVEIVVVDNASSDDSIGRLEERFADRVRIVRRPVNEGYAAGANAGRRATNAPWLAILNQDLTLAPDCLSTLVDTALGWPTTAIVSPLLQLRSSPETVNAVGNDIHWSGVAWCHGAGSPVAAWSGTVEVASVSGAAFVLATQAFDELGGMDEAFFMYMEDVDLSLRARSLGYACLVACDAHAVHDWQPALSPVKFERLEANRRIVWARYLAGPRRRAVVLLQAESMAWLYAALHGRAHLRAKLRASRRRRVETAPRAGRRRVEPWLATHHPYDVMFPRRTMVQRVGRLADRAVLRLAGIPASR